MRRATCVFEHVHELRVISIHALHEESDQARSERPQGHAISIHALHEESDPDLTKLVNDAVFQSTLSMRRAT